MRNDNLGKNQSFLGNMKEQLMRERDLLEKEIQNKDNTERLDDNSNTKLVNCKTSNRNLPLESTFVGKKYMTYHIGVPSFMMKANDDPGRKGNENLKLKNTMMSAIERYEQSLEKAEKNAIAFHLDTEEKATTWNKLQDIETMKRRYNEINTQKFLEFQMEENVRII